MFESEIYRSHIGKEKLPENIRAKFLDLFSQIENRTILSSTEHCTECAWPDCYKTCEFHTPRSENLANPI